MGLVQKKIARDGTHYQERYSQFVLSREPTHLDFVEVHEQKPTRTSWMPQILVRHQKSLCEKLHSAPLPDDTSDLFCRWLPVMVTTPLHFVEAQS
jgi:hypothetical protein